MNAGHMLIYVEDPGAANFILPVIPKLTAANWSFVLSVSGAASSYMKKRAGHATELPSEFSARRFMHKINPQVLLTGTSENPNTPAFDMIEEARCRGIPSVGFVDGPANAQHRFRGATDDPLFHAPDWLLLPDDWTRTQFVACGAAPDHIYVTGHPHFDAVRTKGRALLASPLDQRRRRVLPQAKSGRKIVVFLSEISDGLDPQAVTRSSDYTLQGWGGSDLRTHIVLEEFLDAIDLTEERPYLVLRLHPKDNVAAYSRYLDLFDEVSTSGDPLPLLCVATLIVGMSTILLDEAAATGLATLSILPRECERNDITSVRNGMTACATDRQHLQTLLAQMLASDQMTDKRSIDDQHCGASELVIDALGELRDRSFPSAR